MWPGSNWKEPWKPFEGTAWWSEMLDVDQRLIKSDRARYVAAKKARARSVPLPLWARALLVAKWLIWTIVVVLLACTIVDLISLS